MREPRLGIDIGRVIIDGPAHPGGGDTAFFTGDEEAMLATPEMAGAVATIARLVPRFHGQVWLVSKCGPRVQARTRRWLAGRDFFGRQALPVPDYGLHAPTWPVVESLIHATLPGAARSSVPYGRRGGRV
jgi:hypothetical protein